ncbi:DUF3667 domain-containing protein [Saprospiraceae bacterium]|nr:DUF3667 domain-containing protein [Saprospiraceae bacterium]
MKELGTNSKDQNCKNCSQSIDDSAKYCSSCGQKNTDGRISIAGFFSAFFSTVFNLESKLFQTMGQIFIPGKLTVEYFKGKHKRYFHPVRFFIVAALLLIAAIGSQLTDDMIVVDIHKKVERQVQKVEFLTDLDTVLQQTLEKFPNNASLKPAFDTLYQNLKGKNDHKDSINLGNMINVTDVIRFDLTVSKEDFVKLSPREIVDKYKVEKSLDRFIIQQQIKLVKDKGSFAPFVLRNSLWIILLMMPFLALILKILYIRHDYYYVEHLVYSFHTHAFAFLLFAIIGSIVLLGAPNWLIAVGFGILFIYLYKALRKVYGQGRFKTILKLLFTNIVYFILCVFFLVFGLLASMAIF